MQEAEALLTPFTPLLVLRGWFVKGITNDPALLDNRLCITRYDMGNVDPGIVLSPEDYLYTSAINYAGLSE